MNGRKGRFRRGASVVDYMDSEEKLGELIVKLMVEFVMFDKFMTGFKGNLLCGTWFNVDAGAKDKFADAEGAGDSYWIGAPDAELAVWVGALPLIILDSSLDCSVFITST